MLAVNFVIVPLVVWVLSRFVADDRGLLIGVLLVLLTPVSYTHLTLPTNREV